ncbi:MAG: hypothetical protein KZQ95_01890 [Candidatus Thiodiazotropha sp. (ex Epidulcina cf. delphinae)]|nr:hypothetical protein [Candidatus Thiodiazotropha sp. (ex Epidulcina cf. delphinae)]
MNEKSFLDQTKQLLMETDVPIKKICKDAGLSTRWYYRFISGDIKDPGVQRIQRLHDYLKSKVGQAA